MSAPDIKELERRLDAARELVERATVAVRGKLGRAALDDYKRSLQIRLAAERELAVARGEPACMPLAWQPLWSPGAPRPHVVAGSKSYLLYMVHEPDPTWDGTTSRMVDPSGDRKERIAVVEFRRCYAHRFGGPNDEVWAGHPLYGKGLDFYRAHVIVNSPWIAAERATNEVHPQFRRETWERRQHYLLLFHDQVFECLAATYVVEETVASFGEVLQQLAARVVDRA
ncbi:MAG: hypothetical protein JOZ69_11700 [Myxococcales bacterium]|nr:hypothetical protein [Myxococcales bacterium]